jgi:hypothetical protein
MHMLARQFSDQVVLAQDGKQLDDRGRALLTSIGTYGIPGPLANTGLIISVDDEDRTQAVVHGKTFIASCDHVLKKDHHPTPKLLGRVRFTSEGDDGKTVTILYDELGNGWIHDGNANSSSLMHNLNDTFDCDEMFRKVAIALVGAAQRTLEIIGK